MPTLLLTGSFGMLGTETIQQLAHHNARLSNPNNPLRYTLVAFDLATPQTKSLERALVSRLGRDAFQTTWGDLTSPTFLTMVEELKPAVVIHLAAMIPPSCYDSPDLAERINYASSVALFDTLSAVKPAPAVIYASSCYVFGVQRPDSAYVSASTPLAPLCIYGSAKARCEAHLRSKYKGPWTILRLGALSPDPKFSKTGSQTVRLLFSTPYDQRRHGVDTRDVASAVLNAAVAHVLAPTSVAGRTFMIGGDASWLTRACDFNDALFDAMGWGGFSASLMRIASSPRAYDVEGWMDTASSQAVLRFQHHSMAEWKRHVIRRLGWKRSLTRLFLAPVIQLALRILSPHWRYNVLGKQDPESALPTEQLLKVMNKA